MTSLQPYFLKIKPAMDTFLRMPTLKNVKALQRELAGFEWFHLKIYNVQLLAPLVIKLEEMDSQHSLDVRLCTIDCLRFVTSKTFITDVNGLKSTLIILLKQVQDSQKAAMIPNVCEELKVAVVQCIGESLKRCTSDVLEEFYTTNGSFILGKILLLLVEIIENEKYKTLVLEALDCLMVCFYVHTEADLNDVVMRNQVADTLYIYMPKIVTMLFKISISDEKTGDSIKVKSIRGMGRILCILYEETKGGCVRSEFNIEDFHKLLEQATHNEIDQPMDEDKMFAPKKSDETFEERLLRLQGKGRVEEWFTSSSNKLTIIFQKTYILRSHDNKQIRMEYAKMCTNLLIKCPNNMKENFIYMLESVVAMSQDNDEQIGMLCQKQLKALQSSRSEESLFDANAEKLFDVHLAKLPRILMLGDECEQYAELLFITGLLRNLSDSKLLMFFSIHKNLEIFCLCLLSALDLRLSHDLLNEDYSLRVLTPDDVSEFQKMHWRQFKNLSSRRCLNLVKEICAKLGNTTDLNSIIYEFITELLAGNKDTMNEALLLWTLMATEMPIDWRKRGPLVQKLFVEILKEDHWSLSFRADKLSSSTDSKSTSWNVSRTPGLYESAVEVRTVDYDSDDDFNSDDVVTMADAEFNVMHTCLILDALGNCARFHGILFDRYLFQCLHKVLLRVASSNTIIHQAAMFALTSMQQSLRFAKMSHFIETCADYITYHLNNILRRHPDSKDAVDILTVVLQFSSRNALPHLDSIFSTIRDECSKAYQMVNINSYLKVFNAFLSHVSCWQNICEKEVNEIPMHIDDPPEVDLVKSWLVSFKKHEPPLYEKVENCDYSKSEPENIIKTDGIKKEEPDAAEEVEQNPELPKHVEMTKEIINQVLRFVSSSDQAHQINALECLITGVPLLKDYDHELLPLVHLMWRPMVEKFKQKDPIVLNRCFTLLNVLASTSKDFILKRSLDDIVPFLEKFLLESALKSGLTKLTAHTQEYKLQLILLRELPNLIRCIQIDGKHLNGIAEVVCPYLSDAQPAQLQEIALEFFISLRDYNGPVIYLVVVKKAHMNEFRANVRKVLTAFGIV